MFLFCKKNADKAKNSVKKLLIPPFVINLVQNIYVNFYYNKLYNDVHPLYYHHNRLKF